MTISHHNLLKRTNNKKITYLDMAFQIGAKKISFISSECVSNLAEIIMKRLQIISITKLYKKLLNIQKHFGKTGN